MNTIFNCTLNEVSPFQLEGVYTINSLFIEDQKEKRKDLLSFHWKPSQEEMEFRAGKLAQMAKATGAIEALLEGPSFFVSTLESAMRDKGILPIYAYSIEEGEYVEVT